MSFPGMLAKKYLVTQKRHSLLTILSIAAAITLITVFFTIFSTYKSSSVNIAKAKNEWHVNIYGLTEEQAENLMENKFFVSYEFDGNAVPSDTKIKFSKKIESCTNEIENSLYDLDIEVTNNTYILNKELLDAETIGDEAKINTMQAVAILFIYVLFFAFCARFIIDTAFEISSKEREKQYGVLQSIGASKKQIIKVILIEGSTLSAIGIPLGIALGIGTAYIIYRLIAHTEIIDFLTEGLPASDNYAQFSVSPILLLLSAVTGYVWVLLSAYGVGMRVCKKTPIEIIYNRTNKIVKVGKHRISKLLFGWCGMLASKNTQRNKKRFVITIVSITLSISLYSSFRYIGAQYTTVIEEAFNLSGYDLWIEEINSDEENKPFVPDDFFENEKLLNDSGFFKNVQPVLSIFGYEENNTLNSLETSDNQRVININFVNESTYNSLWKGKPAVEYSQLAKDDSFIYMKPSQENGDFDISVGQTIDNNIKYKSFLDEPLTETNGEKTTTIYWEQKNKKFTHKIAAECFCESQLYQSNEIRVFLIGTQEQYIQKYYKYRLFNSGIRFTADVSDDNSYDEALKFIDNTNMEIIDDLFSVRKATRIIFTTLKFFGYALMIFITVLSLINMTNVISTSILNRKNEFASLKSLGMTKWQLRKVMLNECLQYTVVSGFASYFILRAILLMTIEFVSSLGMTDVNIFPMLEYLKFPYMPMKYEISAIIVVFIVTAAITIIPLRSIEKDSIADAMRTID